MVETTTLRVTGLHCASCVGRAEKALLNVPGVVSATVNLASGTAFVAGRNADGGVLSKALDQAGYPAEIENDPLSAHAETDLAAKTWVRFWQAAALTLPVFLIEMGGHLVPAVHHFVAATLGQTLSWWLQFVLITAVLFVPGRDFFVHGLSALRRFAPEMNSLVALGAGSAWAYSTLVLLSPSLFPDVSRVVYFEAAGVIVTLVLLGRALEAQAKGRAGAAIRALIDLQPETAPVRNGDDWKDMPLDIIRPDDVLLARPGSRIAVDGIVVAGEGHVDEAMLTGEPVPNAKTTGAQLYAGTMNGTKSLEYRATGVGSDTYLARIVGMVSRAQGAKLPVQALIDRVTGVFVPVVMGLAVVAFVGWLVFGGTLAQALVAGVSVLIIACPCAMGLATPVSVVVATGRAAQIGALFRNGAALETLSRVKIAGFDKTGTLTTGRPDVTSQMFVNADISMEDVAAVEAHSEHPLAKAIVAKAAGGGLVATEFEARPGFGASAMVGGRAVAVGSSGYMDELGVSRSQLADTEAQLLDRGETPVFVACDGAIAGILGISDPVKDGAGKALQALKAEGVGLALVSGDRTEVARKVAARLGIDQVHGEVLPDQKQALVAEMRARAPTVFVGDGINDAPALAEADVGIAMGQGTDVALETADVVLMRSDLGILPVLHILGRATLRNILQNLFWAFAYNVALIPVAMGVFYPLFGWQLSPMLGAGAMALSSVFVVTNALRLRYAV